MLRVGDILIGYCDGAFGRDSYGDKRIEAIGADWVVAREIDSGKVEFACSRFADAVFHPDELLKHRKGPWR